MRHLLIALAVFACTASGAATPDPLTEARQQLKNYGFSQCLLQGYPQQQDEFARDLKAAVAAYHFMGRGMHRIHQNEETLETFHDPYAEVERFISQALEQEPAATKQVGNNTFITCLQIQTSPAFDKLLREQDPYISLSD